MKKKKTLKLIIKCRCPKDQCKNIFEKKVKLEYVTNQRGDIIEYKVI